MKELRIKELEKSFLILSRKTLSLMKAMTQLLYVRAIAQTRFIFQIYFPLTKTGKMMFFKYVAKALPKQRISLFIIIGEKKFRWEFMFIM